MPTTFKGIGDNYGQLHPQLAQTGAVFLYYLFAYNQKRNQENSYLHHIAIFRMELFLSGGVEAESKLESKSIFPGRSRGQSRYFQAGVGI